MSVLVIASEAEHPGSARVWGTGGWTPPEEREARDWVTLCRLLGWDVRLATPALDRVPDGVRWAIVACDPHEVGERMTAALRELLELPGTVVVRRAAHGREQIEGRTLRWTGPAEPHEWELAHPLRRVRLEGGGDPVLTLDRAPVAAAQAVGRGTAVTLGFHPSEARDAGAAVSAALRTLLTLAPGGTADWLDLEGVLALRMDDPGGSQNVHLDPFAYRELGPETWRSIADALRSRGAQLGLAVVPGWIDDGDAARGELLVGGRAAEREAGRVHPSWDVVYRDRDGTVHDYAGEFAVLRELARDGLIDVSLHGYTHVDPDVETWAHAADRHTAERWYREFGAIEDPVEAARRLGDGARMVRDYFGAPPQALVFPGDAWTEAGMESALELDVKCVASYYLALRAEGRWCWAEQICSPYLDEPDASWFEAGLPVVGYFHARDVAINGVEWFSELLDAWREAGARRIVGLGELATALER